MTVPRVDPQYSVFHEALPADLVSDGQLAGMMEDGVLSDSTESDVVSVEAYEAQSWDIGREGPKSLEEAKAALAARVADPAASDQDVSAYDGMT